MKIMQQGLLSAFIVMSFAAVAVAQAPAGHQGAAPRLVLWVTTNAWPDGGEIPMKYAAHGEKSRRRLSSIGIGERIQAPRRKI